MTKLFSFLLLLSLTVSADTLPRRTVERFSRNNRLNVTASAGGCTSCNSGLIHYWPFTANGNDAVGSRNTSTNGTVNFGVNGAVQTGGGSLVNTPIDPGTSWSWGGVVRVTVLNGYNPLSIVGGVGALHGILIVAGGQLEWVSFVGVETKDTTILTINTTYYLFVTYDNTSIRFYVNGVLSSTVILSIAGASLYKPDAFLRAANFYELTGSIKYVGVWNRVVTGAEITTLHNGGMPLTYPF